MTVSSSRHRQLLDQADLRDQVPDFLCTYQIGFATPLTPPSHDYDNAGNVTETAQTINVDTKQRTPQAMMNLITPILDTLAAMGTKNVYFKFFLPLELDKSVKVHIRSIRVRLYR